MRDEKRWPPIPVSSRAVLARAICLTTATLCLLGAAASPAEAAKLFVGGTIGQSQVKARFTDTDFSDIELGGSNSTSDSAFAYRLFAGFRLGGLGVEAGYRDFGRVSDSGEEVSIAIDTDGVDAFLTGNLSLGPIHLFAKGGLIFWNSTVGLDGVDFDSSGSDLAWGVGIAYERNRLGFRLEYEAFDVSTPDDLATISLGITFNILGD